MTTEAAEAPPARVAAQRCHICPECGERFKAGRDALFCCQAHKDAFHNRMAKRGKVMTPLVLAWRAGRGAKGREVSKWAHTQMSALADGFNAEDRAAGRMSMEAYLKRKMSAGWSAADAL